ncbi:hypothetical protein FB567DRAFT_131381 [Paraphoma chrysanthemicola]|uniref:Uncharacterized protein n=1 Tax=Paraphoma chrysanthemicola TaxID=798071 RepID=A0A8K0QY58_9PLEO|nr:hypothetical protein FB567DRAFT_131381 [Paraphoma chrysanthemicola]
MPEPQRDDHGTLTTATIFDDAVYWAEALALASDVNENDVDAALALLAQESGIEDPYRYLCPPQDISRALSTMTLDSDHRSSMSIHSQETQSTSFTSAPSRTSRDQSLASERLPSHRAPPKTAHMSPTIEQDDAPMNSSSPGTKQDPSTSTVSLTRSVPSSSSSSSSPAPRKKRASLFGMFRKDSNSCTSHAHHGHLGKGRGPKLVCGHSLSPNAIQIHIQEARQRGPQAVPSCCGYPLPREILQVVLEKEELDLAISRTLQPPAPVSSRDSGYCEKVVSAVDLTHSLDAASQPATSTSLPLSPSRRRHEAISIDLALANEAFRSFRSEEKEQLERVAAFECNQRKALSAYHACSFKRLAVQHGASRDAKLDQHTLELEHLEEAQILAEHDLRKAHDVETQNAATALKHMEAYCLGGGPTHPQHPHVVTEEDFKKLDRQRMLQQNLPRKHENAINVLRARQERELKNKLQKQEMELELLEASQEKERAAEESDFTKEAEKLEVVIEGRRRRLLQRWDLKFEMWRREWEEKHGAKVNVSLEHEHWPLQLTNTITPIPESSSLATYVRAAA